MSTTYREENIRRKAVRSGALELRPLCSSSRKKDEGDWLVVELTKSQIWHARTPLQRERAEAKPSRFKILDHFKSEEIAHRSCTKSYRYYAYGRTFICHREVFDRVYRDLLI